MATTIDVLFLAGRLLLGGFFVTSGINHFRHRKMMAGYAASKGLPAPLVAVVATGLLLLAGGASVITGVLPRIGLALLALFLVGVTPVMHAYWKVDDPMARMGEQVNFQKNVALLGAVLALAVVPAPWAWNLVALLP